MDLSAFSRKGGRARSAAKTLANRAKMTAFWRQVRRGDRPPPRRLRRFPDPIRALARRYLWWLPPDEALAQPQRVIAQVMDLGTWADCAALEAHFGRALMRKTLRHAEPGWFRPRSWVYWHFRLGLTPWGQEAPPSPSRRFAADAVTPSLSTKARALPKDLASPPAPSPHTPRRLRAKASA